MKFIAILIVIYAACTAGQLLNEFKTWTQLDWKFPSEAIRQKAIRDGNFVPASAIPIDVAADYRGSLDRTRVFVTTPRFSSGVPASLSFIRSAETQLNPYPSYDWHSSQGKNCDGLTSVFRVAMDTCDQLWVLDSGKIDGQQLCQPQLVIFNLKNDKLVHRYRFDRKLYRDISLLITPLLDVKDPDKCRKVKAYIADVTGNGLIVYDHQTQKAWRVENRYFYPYPSFAKMTIAGESFFFNDGILGMEISKAPLKHKDSDRSLLFHAFASGTENAVSLGILNNSTIWDANPSALPDEFKMIGTRGVQTGAQAMDRNGNLFFVLLNPIALVCWDSSTNYNADNIKIVYKNDLTMQFSGGMKIVKNLSGEEELWFITNRLQKFMTGSMVPTEVNYRVNVGMVRVLLNNQPKCNGQSLKSIQQNPIGLSQTFGDDWKKIVSKL